MHLSTTLHGLHTYRNFDLQILTYLSTYFKNVSRLIRCLFPRLSHDIELLDRINHGILVLAIVAQGNCSDCLQIVINMCAIVSKIITGPKTQRTNLNKSIRA